MFFPQSNSSLHPVASSLLFVIVSAMLCILGRGSILAVSPPNPTGQDWAFGILPLLVPAAAFGFSGYFLGLYRKNFSRDNIETVHTIGLVVGQLPLLVVVLFVGRAWPIWFALTAMVFTVIVLTHRSMNLLAELKRQA